ncbi:MAG TPA: peptide ABC transporter substrate-binding protein [Candidatus Saccharimonadales bacterium]|nr:peptide ABC transporter substrate-binding protein [Candidatus Saccharimonadales bacterium]
MNLSFKKPKIPDNPSETIKDRLEEIEQATVSHAQKYLVRRWANFRDVGQKALIWLIVVMAISIGVIQQTKALDGFYKVSIPAVGGVYSEGVVGRAENFNPMFASSEAEATVSHLLFSGLLKYDASNNLTGDLASGWNADETGKVYTVTLRADARWQDGTPVRSDDVVYTVHTIQDPATRSPLESSWRGVSVQALDPTTVRFTLPSPFPPFPYSLTLGIIPQHILGDTPAYQLRTSSFNLQPTVGDGPFSFQEARAFQNHEEVKLVRNPGFYGGQAKPDRFVVEAYQNYDDMVDAFRNHEISAAGGLRPAELTSLKAQGVQRFNAPLQHATFAFFKTSQIELQDIHVRQALTLATDKTTLLKKLDNWFTPINLPLLKGQIGYNPALDVSSYNQVQAGALLDQAGWVKDASGVRHKDGKPLELNLVASSSDEYPIVAAELQRQWQSLGITIHTSLIKPSDFQQNVIIPHNYDILLYELAIGQDPDVFAYWHSSQAVEKGLNLSEYRSQRADEALEGGRTRINPTLRAAKYTAFLDQWVADDPAVALYQPGYGYAFRSSVSGFQAHTLVDPVDRFTNITDWTAENRQAIATH